MTDLLLAIPWWLFITLIVAGIVVFLAGNNRGQKNARYAGISLVLLALLLKGISFFVVTDKEKVTRLTNDLVQSVQDRNWDKFGSLLDPDVSVSGSGFTNKKLLVEATKDDCEHFNVTGVTGHVADVQQDASGITVDIDASSDQSAMGMTARIPTSWKIFWVKSGDDWHVHEITYVSRTGKDDPVWTLIQKSH